MMNVSPIIFQIDESEGEDIILHTWLEICNKCIKNSHCGGFNPTR